MQRLAATVVVQGFFFRGRRPLLTWTSSVLRYLQRFHFRVASITINTVEDIGQVHLQQTSMALELVGVLLTEG